jgi:pyridoxal phosphate enzyme (YggS family)
MSTLSDRLDEIRSRIDAAAVRSGRAPGDVELVAVSKTHPAAAVREAYDAGQTLFGESRVQEAAEKIPDLPAAAHWHFIGHLQTNKIRKALPLFELFHSIDSVDLARGVDRIAAEEGSFPRVLLEVNVAGEASKFGFTPHALEACIDDLLTLDRLQIEGVMVIPPLAKNPEDTRPHFVALHAFRDRLATRTGVPLSTLSMGMSDDYEIAIEEGATLVRVGTAIFGER